MTGVNESVQVSLVCCCVIDYYWYLIHTAKLLETKLKAYEEQTGFVPHPRHNSSAWVGRSPKTFDRAIYLHVGWLYKNSGYI